MTSVTCSACMNQVEVPADWQPGGEIQCPFCYSSLVPEEGAGLELEKVKEAVDNCCPGETECGGCQHEACLIGFAKKAVDIAEGQGTVRISGGEELLPKGDFKYYDPASLEEGLVEVILTCKSCQENHTADCVRNLLRNCMEIALLGKTVDYKGSVFLYLADLTKEDKDMGERVAATYRARKGLT